ncbi:MAG: flagellar biosynthetic protein FliR [Rubellimicrobium sp.]|nr:flagellar biosynthetic protein FliR [Rubellimicrobium sp.]
MNAGLSAWLALALPWLGEGFLVFLRVGAVVALAPAFGEQTVPVRLRLIAALCLTLCVLPAVMPEVSAAALGLTQSGMLRAGLGETAAGLVFGVVLRLMVLALQTAGTIAAQSVSLAQMAGGGLGPEPAPAVGHLMVVGGIALAASVGLHVRLAAYLIDSYRLIPPGLVPSSGVVATAGIGAVSRSFALAFSLALPFVIAALLYNLLLGVINRAMPQLMVTFIGAPLLTAGSILLLLAVAPVLVLLWSEALGAVLAAPFAGPP